MVKDCLLVLTTDHGGVGTTHGKDSNLERNVFIIMMGPGIKKNSMFGDNLTRNLDCTSIILHVLQCNISCYFDSQLPLCNLEYWTFLS